MPEVRIKGRKQVRKERVVSIRWTSVLSADRMRPLRHSDLTMSMSTWLWDRATNATTHHHNSEVCERNVQKLSIRYVSDLANDFLLFQ